MLRVERDLDIVVENAKGNIDRVIQRGTHMELLKIKTENLNTGTKKLRMSTQRYNYDAWKKKVKLYILAGAMGGVCLYYAYFWVADK